MTAILHAVHQKFTQCSIISTLDNKIARRYVAYNDAFVFIALKSVVETRYNIENGSNQKFFPRRERARSQLSGAVKEAMNAKLASTTSAFGSLCTHTPHF